MSELIEITPQVDCPYCGQRYDATGEEDITTFDVCDGCGNAFGFDDDGLSGKFESGLLTKASPDVKAEIRELQERAHHANGHWG